MDLLLQISYCGLQDNGETNTLRQKLTNGFRKTNIKVPNFSSLIVRIQRNVESFIKLNQTQNSNPYLLFENPDK